MIEQKRRYLMLTQLFLPTQGGTAVWFAEVYRRLGGRDTHIVTAAVPGGVAFDATHPNAIHRLRLRLRLRLQRTPWLRPESLMIYLKLLFKALQLVTTTRFDAIHAARALPEGLVAWLAARLAGYPVLIYCHGEELTTWGTGRKYRAMRFALTHVDLVVVNSDYTREGTLRIGVAPARITVIHPGVDVQRFRPDLPFGDLRQQLGLGGQKLILSVGRLQRRKGFDMLVRALPRLLAGGLDVHYAVIGTGEDGDYLRRLAVEQRVAGHVHFLGPVISEELPRWYNACDVFAMPNRAVGGDTEGFGMVYLEAAACGRPVIAGKAGGSGSAVVDGETGLQVDGAELEQVVGALSTLLLQPERIRLMGVVLKSCCFH